MCVFKVYPFDDPPPHYHLRTHNTLSVAGNGGDSEKDSNNPDGFEPIQDDDVHRFHGDFQHLDIPSGLNGTTEREWIDHGEHDYPGMTDDYVAMRGREEYYYHYGRRHRIHSAYMDD